MSSTIINTYFNQADRVCITATQDIAEPSEEIDEDGTNILATTLVSVSNHSLRTYRQAYVNASPFANIWDSKLVKSHNIS
jgi:hypothetical protein